MSTFGGIWKDFAVEQPGQDCFDSDGFILVKRKDSDSVLSWGFVPDGDNSDYQWLDRRVPRSLTAEQAFDIISVLYPGVMAISKLDGEGRYTRVHPDVDPIDIEWNGLSVYSPPGNGEWVEVTKENWLTYLHKSCACGASLERNAYLMGSSPQGDLVVMYRGGGLAFESVVRVQV